MIKRFAAGLLLSMALCVAALGSLAATASAQSVARASGPVNYGTQPGSSTTDPCLTGNGTSATTSGNCFPTSPGGSTAVTTETQSFTTPSSSSSSLATTGTDVIGAVIVAFLLIGGGLVVVRLSRRSHGV